MSGGGGRGGLLDAIRGGAQLRKATPTAAAPPSGRSGLLSEIQGRNFALKKVEERKQEEVSKPPAMISGAAASIAAVLARRSAISGDDSDSGESDDDWD